ncbi:MAG TPA: thymidylate synthase, partial [Buchnera sp. (in: enterobacteria)]|nr:thymidylate synthase [Buchnera sp. (in: enterobacteria)]
HMIAQQCDLKVGDFLWTGGDIHLYNNHLIQAKNQILRIPRKKPTLVIKNKPNSLFNYHIEDFLFIGYKPLPSIQADVSV